MWYHSHLLHVNFLKLFGGEIMVVPLIVSIQKCKFNRINLTNSFVVPSYEGVFCCSVPSYEGVFVVLYLFG